MQKIKGGQEAAERTGNKQQMPAIGKSKLRKGRRDQLKRMEKGLKPFNKANKNQIDKTNKAAMRDFNKSQGREARKEKAEKDKARA